MFIFEIIENAVFRIRIHKNAGPNPRGKIWREKKIIKKFYSVYFKNVMADLDKF